MHLRRAPSPHPPTPTTPHQAEGGPRYTGGMSGGWGRGRHSPAIVDQQTQQNEHQQGQGCQDGEQEDGVVGANVLDARCDGDQSCARQGLSFPGVAALPAFQESTLPASPSPAAPLSLTSGGGSHGSCPVPQLGGDEGPVELPAFLPDHTSAVAYPEPWERREFHETQHPPPI